MKVNSGQQNLNFNYVQVILGRNNIGSSSIGSEMVWMNGPLNIANISI